MEGNSLLVDRLSELPVHLLVSIISLLTLKEAGRTSVLSRSWKHLWKSFAGSLKFEGLGWFDKVVLESYYPSEETPGFVRRVNQFMDSHQSTSIEEFRVRFELDKDSKSDIDRWISIAFSKKVRTLELDFEYPLNRPSTSEDYIFPQELFYGMQPSSIKFLVCLSLKQVRVTGEFLHYVLSNCPALKQLCVHCSEVLVELQVSGSSLQLEELELVECDRFERLEISAPKLVSLKYEGRAIQLHIENAPLLSDVFIGGFSYIYYAFEPLSSYLPQLEALTLDMNLFKPYPASPRVPELVRLKRLTWIISSKMDRSLLVFVPLIKSAPSLHTFTLELSSHKSERDRELVELNKCPHLNLRIIKIVGFVGEAIAVELASYLLESATMLEKIIIIPRPPSMIGGHHEFSFEETEKKAKQEVQEHLIPKLPLGAELLLL